MNSVMLQKLGDAGADINQTLQRFMNNEGIYVKFLGKFLDDPSFKGLEESMDQKDYEEALRQAHTLKGVAGNLGLTPIFKAAETMVANFRAGELGGIEGEFEDLKAKYIDMVTIIRANK
ncbi:MAG: Hpt domain-containing protein [Lachnospiraceae bacterium]|nr:Hpt domain-containing protein [Lachnospiraceae bacterium]